MNVRTTCLRHRSDMVNLEAARAISTLQTTTATEIFPAVSVLQLLLNSSKPALKLGAVRTLSALSAKDAASVSTLNLDLEALVADTNKSVSTFAITTLLNTGTEASLERLLKHISGVMADTPDEFKVRILSALLHLILKFPSKASALLTFLSSSLRDEGGYETKSAMVDAIFGVLTVCEEKKNEAFAALCEFIEDCEFSQLVVRVVRSLGKQGPSLSLGHTFVRFIYNRTILENAPVRAAAVSALGKYYASPNQEESRKDVKVLLERCVEDVDDEVRDRALLALNVGILIFGGGNTL